MMKLNKKGFTLVELLAVIVVLALLMVVAASSIGNAMENSKKSATKTEAQKILKTVYEENYALYSLGTLTDGSGKTGEDGDFTYKYDVAANATISNFCLKHKDGIYVAGSVTEAGKQTILDVEDKEYGKCVASGSTTIKIQTECTAAGATWTSICPS